VGVLSLCNTHLIHRAQPDRPVQLYSSGHDGWTVQKIQRKRRLRGVKLLALEPVIFSHYSHGGFCLVMEGLYDWSGEAVDHAMRPFADPKLPVSKFPLNSLPCPRFCCTILCLSHTTVLFPQVLQHLLSL